MTTIEKLDMIRFKLEFMTLMINTDRIEEAQTSLDAAYKLLDEVKSTVECSTQERVTQ